MEELLGISMNLVNTKGYKLSGYPVGDFCFRLGFAEKNPSGEKQRDRPPVLFQFFEDATEALVHDHKASFASMLLLGSYKHNIYSVATSGISCCEETCPRRPSLIPDSAQQPDGLYLPNEPDEKPLFLYSPGAESDSSAYQSASYTRDSEHFTTSLFIRRQGTVRPSIGCTATTLSSIPSLQLQVHFFI